MDGEVKRCIVGELVGLRHHPKLAHLDVAKIAGRTVVVGKHYEEGNLGFFIPDGAIIPQKLLEEMWLWNKQTSKGRLAGKRGDRVKARDMEGVFSEGLFYGAYYFHEGERVVSPSWNPDWKLGDDPTIEVGITYREGGDGSGTGPGSPGGTDEVGG